MSFIKVYYPSQYCPTPQTYAGYSFVIGLYEMIKEEECELYDLFHRFFSLSFQDGAYGGKYIHGAALRSTSENFTWDLKAGFTNSSETQFQFKNLNSTLYTKNTTSFQQNSNLIFLKPKHDGFIGYSQNLFEFPYILKQKNIQGQQKFEFLYHYNTVYYRSLIKQFTGFTQIDNGEAIYAIKDIKAGEDWSFFDGDNERYDFCAFGLGKGGEKFLLYPYKVNNIEFLDLYFYDYGNMIIPEKSIIVIEDRAFLCPWSHSNLLIELDTDDWEV